MNLRDYILRRLVVLPILIIGVSIVVFTLTRVGGSPICIYLSHEMSPSEVAEIKARFNMDKPVWTQYLYWIRGIFQGDFGWSGVAAAPVSDVFPIKLAATMELAFCAGLVALFLGITLGTYAGARRNRLPDHITRIIAVSGASMPQFWFGIILLIIFWANLGIAPIGRSDATIFASIGHPTGLYTIDSIIAGSPKALWDAIWHLILPALTLGFGATAIIARMMRSALVEELQQDYVDSARAKGLAERIVIKRHARRNALVPTVTVIGLGRWMADSVLRGDQATLMTYVLFTSILFLMVNLIVDVVYANLDRRVTLGK